MDLLSRMGDSGVSVDDTAHDNMRLIHAHISTPYAHTATSLVTLNEMLILHTHSQSRSTPLFRAEALLEHIADVDARDNVSRYSLCRLYGC